MRAISSRFGDLHLGIHSPSDCHGYLLFVHGGPGGHSAYFEGALGELEPYRKSKLGWITYDQRGCGRSASGDSLLSHNTNIEDLAALLNHAQKKLSLPIKALVGHSYGARLIFDFSEKHSEVSPPLVLLGLGPLAKAPRNRSLMMDLIALKMQQPSDYESLVQEIGIHSGPPWTLAATVRKKMQDTGLRKYFYWGSLAAEEWYEKMREKTPLAENEDVYRRVRESMYNGQSALNLPSEEVVGKKILWIHGFHDFLMGGESLEDDSRKMTVFLSSGHYPHFEEPARFLSELEGFLA